MSGVPKSGPKPKEIQTLSEIWCFLIICIGCTVETYDKKSYDKKSRLLFLAFLLASLVEL